MMRNYLEKQQKPGAFVTSLYQKMVTKTNLKGQPALSYDKVHVDRQEDRLIGACPGEAAALPRDTLHSVGMTQLDDISGPPDERPERPSCPCEGLRAYATLQGVGRAIEVLEAVAERPMRAKEIAETLGLKWTTAYRTITYLYEHRYLRRDDASGVHSIGPRLYYLGQSYLLDNPLLAAGAQTLRVSPMRPARTRS